MTRSQLSDTGNGKSTTANGMSPGTEGAFVAYPSRSTAYVVLIKLMLMPLWSPFWSKIELAHLLTQTGMARNQPLALLPALGHQ